MKISVSSAVASAALLVLGMEQNVSAQTTVTSFGLVGGDPQFMDFDADNNAWVVLRDVDAITKVSRSGETLQTIDVGTRPTGIALYSSQIWLTNSGDGTVEVLDQATGSSLQIIDVGGYPAGIRINSLGQVWVAVWDGSVVVLDSTGTQIVTHSVSRSAWDIDFDSKNNAWIICRADPGAIHRITQGTWTVSNALAGSVLRLPTGIAVDSNDVVWATSMINNLLVKFRAGSGVLATFATGVGPADITIGENGHIWVAHSGDNSVWEYDAYGKKLGTSFVGEGPWSLAVDKNGKIWTVNAVDSSISLIA